MISGVSKLQIFNIALGFVGTRTISDVDENSPEAIQCNLYWDRARRSVLRDCQYQFAIKRAALESATVPATYAGVWSNCYRIPDDALKVVSIHSGSSEVREPFFLESELDVFYVLCNVANAQMTYAADVTNMAFWDERFVSAISRKLALLIANSLLKNNPNKIQELHTLYEESLPKERWGEEGWAITVDSLRLNICNQALGLVGAKPIASLYENSEEAVQCSVYWDRARRSVLRDYPFRFSLRTVALQSATMPAVHGGSWQYCYTYPAAALRILSIHSDSDDETRQPFAVEYLDNSTCILCNVENARCIYISDVPNIDVWDEKFASAMGCKLALLINGALSRDAEDGGAKRVESLGNMYKASMPGEIWQEEQWAVIDNSTKLNIFNRALTMIGLGMVSSVTENTPAAVQCNLHWDNARRAVLRDYPFDFALRKVALEETTMPTITRGTWKKAYLVPSDSLRVLSVFKPEDTTTRQAFTVQYHSSFHNPPVNNAPTVESFSHALTRGESAVPVVGNALDGSTLGDGTAEEHTFVWGDDVSEFGTMTKNTNGTYNYVIDNNNPRVRALIRGKNLNERFGYTYTDKDGDTANGTVDVEIYGIGDEVEYDFIYDVDTRLAFTEDDLPSGVVFQENKTSSMPFVMDKSYPDVVLRVDWGDGYVAEYTNDTYVTNHSQHTYKKPGEYRIKVKCNKWEAIRTRYFYGPWLGSSEPYLQIGNLTGDSSIPWYFKGTVVAIHSPLPKTQSEYYQGNRWYNDGVSDDPISFFNYSNLKYVSGNLLDNYRDANTVGSMFTRTQLEEIPDTLFSRMSSLTRIGSGTFEATRIVSIPDSLLNDCVNIESIPRMFAWTPITSIPENLFANCSMVKDFEGCFMHTNITTVPENLFAQCQDAENFKYVFQGCEGLEQIGNVFRFNTSAKWFADAFIGCSSLTLPIPSDIFNHSESIMELHRWFGSATLEWDGESTPPEVEFYVSSPNVAGGLAIGGAFVLVNQNQRAWVKNEEKSEGIEGDYFEYYGPVVRVHVPAGTQTETTFRMSGFVEEGHEKIVPQGQWIPDNIYAGGPYVLVLE